SQKWFMSGAAAQPLRHGQTWWPSPVPGRSWRSTMCWPDHPKTYRPFLVRWPYHMSGTHWAQGFHGKGLGTLAGELELKRVEKRRTWQEVVHQIETQILEGHLRPGDRLQGERKLAEQLGVRRESVREALRVLGALEVIR